MQPHWPKSKWPLLKFSRVDEHIPLMTVQALPMMGHDVRDIRGTPDEGMQDDALWEMAQREERLLNNGQRVHALQNSVAPRDAHHTPRAVTRFTNALCRRCGNLTTRNGPVYW